jgi:hypothetical protein
VHTQSSPAVTAIVVDRSQPCEPSSHGCSVGKCVGDVVGILLVGTSVGLLDGSTDGASVGYSVGARVSLQLVCNAAFGFEGMKPSKQWQAHPAPDSTAMVVRGSHWCCPSAHGDSVGMCVGAVLGTTVVGCSVGASVGTSVTNSDGAAVGLAVVMQRVGSIATATKPSKQVHTQSSPAVTAIVEDRSQPCEPSSHGCSVGKCVGDVVGVGDGATVGA